MAKRKKPFSKKCMSVAKGCFAFGAGCYAITLSPLIIIPTCGYFICSSIEKDMK